MALRTSSQITSDTLRFRKQNYAHVQLISQIQRTQLNKGATDNIDVNLAKCVVIEFVLSSPYSTDVQKSLAIDFAAEIGYLSPVRDGYWVSNYSVNNY